MKILSSDFDETIFFGDIWDYHQVDLDAIVRFQEKGNKFGLCTGRARGGILLCLPKDVKFDYYITCSGSTIYDKDFNVLFEKKIPNRLLKILFKKYESTGCMITYDGIVNISYAGRYPRPFPIIRDIDSFDQDVNSFSIHFQNEEDAHDSLSYIRSFEELDAFQNGEFVDVAYKGVSKANGIRFIESYFNIDHKDSYCIGDNFNDVPMLKYCDTSFSFTYSPEEVQKISTHVVESCAQAIDLLLEE